MKAKTMEGREIDLPVETDIFFDQHTSDDGGENDVGRAGEDLSEREPARIPGQSHTRLLRAPGKVSVAGENSARVYTTRLELRLQTAPALDQDRSLGAALLTECADLNPALAGRGQARTVRGDVEVVDGHAVPALEPGAPANEWIPGVVGEVEHRLG